MDKKYKITIAEPCQEDWNKMTPNGNGRFCMICSKTVVDFTSMLPEEIQHFFIQNQNQKICGRFKKSQLDTITIQIPSQVLYTQINYHKMFILALFVAMGTTLFSCKDTNGNKQKIDTVEVVEEAELENNITKGKTLRGKSETPPPPLPKLDSVKFTKEKTQRKNSNFFKAKPISSGETIKKETVVEDVIYNGGTSIETNAEFPGGIEQLYNFFEKEFKKPEDINITNLKIKISFSVERNGSMLFLQSEPAIDKVVETEIIRVLSLCPKWQPAESNGRKIRMQYSLPLVIK